MPTARKTNSKALAKTARKIPQVKLKVLTRRASSSQNLLKMPTKRMKSMTHWTHQTLTSMPTASCTKTSKSTEVMMLSRISRTSIRAPHGYIHGKARCAPSTRTSRAWSPVMRTTMTLMALWPATAKTKAMGSLTKLRLSTKMWWMKCLTKWMRRICHTERYTKWTTMHTASRMAMQRAVTKWMHKRRKLKIMVAKGTMEMTMMKRMKWRKRTMRKIRRMRRMRRMRKMRRRMRMKRMKRMRTKRKHMRMETGKSLSPTLRVLSMSICVSLPRHSGNS